MLQSISAKLGRFFFFYFGILFLVFYLVWVFIQPTVSDCPLALFIRNRPAGEKKVKSVQSRRLVLTEKQHRCCTINVRFR